MGILSIILVGIGLSMDAFAVSVSNGMAIKELRLGKALRIGLFFGGFQALMPVLGWAAGFQFKAYIVSIDHWLAFGLLAFIGIKMIREAMDNKEACSCSSDDELAVSRHEAGQAKVLDNVLSFKCLVILAVATSIDALAVGVSFAFLKVSILQASLLIGFITLIICTAGVYIGRKCGDLLKKKAEIGGGAILILMGLKILVEHLGLLDWLTAMW